MRISIPPGFSTPARFGLLSCLLALAGCNRSGSMVTVEPGGGRFFTSDGKPAANARVRFYPVAYLPSESTLVADPGSGIAFETRTDAQGHYTPDGLAKGGYNIMASLDGESAFLDSVFVDGPEDTLPGDTLGVPASLTRHIALQPGHDPRTITVQILGTNIYSNVDADGKFTLAGLADGRYTLRAATTLPQYTATFRAFAMEEGMPVGLDDSLRIIFTGIPAVTGLHATFDTLHGVAKLTWDESAYRNLEDYGIFREPATATALSNEAVAYVRDTVYLDTVYEPDGSTPFPAQAESPTLRYRVKIRDRFTDLGGTYGSLLLPTPPPATVKTAIRITGDLPGDSASINDTIRLAATFENKGRKVVRLQWYSEDSTLSQERSDSAHSGKDSALFVTSKLGVSWVRMAATDVSGLVYEDTILIRTVPDKPRPDLPRGTFIMRGDSYLLRGKAEDGFGRIVKWEWDIGATGNFVEVPSRDTLIFPDVGIRKQFTCILRVTDDDGEVAVASILFSPLRWGLKASRPTLPGATTGNELSVDTLNGKIYLHEKRDRPYLTEYDPATNRWRIEEGSNAAGTMRSLLGKLYFIDGTASMKVFDPATNTETTKAPMPQGHGGSPEFIAAGNLIYAVAGNASNSLDAYDPVSDVWVAKPAIPYTNLTSSMSFTAAGDGSDIFAFPTNGGTENYRFHPGSDQWTPIGRPSYGAVLLPVARDGAKIYLLEEKEMHGYEHSRGWTKSKPIIPFFARPRTTYNSSCLPNNGKVTCFLNTGGDYTYAQDNQPQSGNWQPVYNLYSDANPSNPGEVSEWVETKRSRFKAFLINGQAFIVAWGKPNDPAAEPDPIVFEYLLTP